MDITAQKSAQKSANQLLILLHRIDRAAIRHANQVLSEAECPVGYLQFIALKAIHESNHKNSLLKGKVCVRLIAESIGLDRSTFSHNLDVLDREGFVIRDTRRIGQNITKLQLTEAGQEVISRWGRLYDEMTSKMVQGLPEGFAEGLERIGHNLL